MSNKGNEMNQHLRTTDKVLPLTYGGWDMAGDYGEVQLYDVEFTDDFGPFKKGEKVENLLVSQSQGIIADYDDGGERLRTVNIKYVPV
jgi:hypothetical protein